MFADMPNSSCKLLVTSLLKVNQIQCNLTCDAVSNQNTVSKNFRASSSIGLVKIGEGYYGEFSITNCIGF